MRPSPPRSRGVILWIVTRGGGRAAVSWGHDRRISGVGKRKATYRNKTWGHGAHDTPTRAKLRTRVFWVKRRPIASGAMLAPKYTTCGNPRYDVIHACFAVTEVTGQANDILTRHSATARAGW